MDSIIIGYAIYALIIALLGIIFAIKCFGTKMWGAKYLGFTFANSVAVNIWYLLSIVTQNYFFSSLMSSLYFAFIDAMVLSFAAYAYASTKRGKRNGRFRYLYYILQAYAVFDIIVLMINPFREIAMHYVWRDTPIAHFGYDRLPLYNMHLGFSYIVVAIAVVLIFRKMISVPGEYQNQFAFIILGVLAIIFVNAVFLYIPDKGVVSTIDVSIIGYEVVGIICYWASYEYTTHGMLNHFKNVIFENIGQGLILFDYEDLLILANARARQLVTGVDYENAVTFQEFIDNCGITWDWEGHGVHSLQCYPKGRALRCDCSIIRGRHDRPLGKLFVFTDAQMDTDPLTGFEQYEHFRSFALENKQNFPYPTSAVVFDINSLAVYNSRFGRKRGDLKIQELADKLRATFPKDTYFVRGTDAQLIAICYQKTEEEIHEIVGDISGDVQYAVACNKDEDIVDTVNTAMAALRNKKLLSHGSSHSELVASLSRALEECDPDTSEHVKRTQLMGKRLTERLKLPDIDRSQLSLLCLLHDIGKIGIPLEILNKPGPLNPQEEAVIRSHVQKGYQIAKSSKELSGIADMILHHHERWDGQGYPDGLSKESIPVLSRIIAIIDSYDAMTNDRIYRKGMTQEDAAAELRCNAGTQFDPRITAEFLDMIKDDLEKEAKDAGTHTERRESAPSLSSERTKSAVEEYENRQDSLHSLKTAICYTTDNMEFLSVNQEFTSLTGYTSQELSEDKNPHNLSILVPEDERTNFLLNADRLLASKKPMMAEFPIVTKSGEKLLVLASFRKYFDSARKNQRYEIMITNIGDSYLKEILEQNEKNRSYIQLNRWENHFRRDSLTKLLSHEAFISDLEYMLLSKEYRVLMIMFDIDNFKEVNDTYGHVQGDNVLIHFANTLKSSVRSTDLAGRLGGDEFALALLFDLNIGEQEISKKAQNLFNEVKADMASLKPKITISAGAVISKLEGITAARMYQNADDALYQSKDSGKRRLTIHFE